MPASTQNLKKFLEQSENLFEATMIIAKRARQINEELFQKKRDQQILEELSGSFDGDYLQVDQEELDTEAPQVEEEENPVVTAQREFLQGKLAYHYEAPRR